MSCGGFEPRAFWTAPPCPLWLCHCLRSEGWPFETSVGQESLSSHKTFVRKAFDEVETQQDVRRRHEPARGPPPPPLSRAGHSSLGLRGRVTSQAYNRAVAIFSEALKVQNPIGAPWAAAAAAV